MKSLENLKALIHIDLEIMSGLYNLVSYISTEELAHLEIVGSIVHQLTKGVPAKRKKNKN